MPELAANGKLRMRKHVAHYDENLEPSSAKPVLRCLTKKAVRFANPMASEHDYVPHSPMSDTLLTAEPDMMFYNEHPDYMHPVYEQHPQLPYVNNNTYGYLPSVKQDYSQNEHAYGYQHGYQHQHDPSYTQEEAYTHSHQMPTSTQPAGFPVAAVRVKNADDVARNKRQQRSLPDCKPLRLNKRFYEEPDLHMAY